MEGWRDTSPRDVENVDRSSCANWANVNGFFFSLGVKG